MNAFQWFIFGVALLTGVKSNLDVVRKDYIGDEVMDPKDKYRLQYKIDWPKKFMYFNVTLEGTGYIGLGFSKDGTMKEADIVMAGVSPEGKPYIYDYYTDCERNLKQDAKQDWNLLGANQYAGKTIVYLSRLIDTCDPNDYPIKEDLVYVLWAYGETDALEYHYENRGSQRMYLLDPVLHQSPLVDASPTWNISSSLMIPPRYTTYWCSMHRAPAAIRGKHHIIKFAPFFANEIARTHIHHFVLYLCKPPIGADPRTVFDKWVNHPGEHCYANDNPIMPRKYCEMILYFWTLGSKPFQLPDYAGMAIGETSPSYVLLETHYNNVGRHENIQSTAGVQAVYTSQLRPNDAGGLLVAYDLTGLFLIPPAAYDFEVYGHCGTNCSNAMFPTTGIEVFAVHLHSHSSAKRMTLQHFSNGKEKPWIMSDRNYDFQFQQIRPLHYNRKVIPGDQLTVSCVYDFSNSTEVSGFSAYNKMCVAMIYHVTRIPYFICVSQITQDKILSVIGVNEASWDKELQDRIVSDPLQYKGLTIQQVSDKKIDWTYHLRERIQSLTTTSPQTYSCPKAVPPEDGASGTATVVYPLVSNPYTRVRYCSAVASGKEY